MSKLTRIEEAKDPECFLDFSIFEEDYTVKYILLNNSKNFEPKF